MSANLDIEDALQVVERSGFHVRDVGLLASALARPATTIMGTEAYPELALKAAAMLESVARFHPLVDGNWRSAWTLMVLLLWINWYRHNFPADEGSDLVVGVAAGSVELKNAAGRWYGAVLVMMSALSGTLAATLLARWPRCSRYRNIVRIIYDGDPGFHMQSFLDQGIRRAVSVDEYVSCDFPTQYLRNNAGHALDSFRVGDYPLIGCRRLRSGRFRRRLPRGGRRTALQQGPGGRCWPICPFAAAHSYKAMCWSFGL